MTLSSELVIKLVDEVQLLWFYDAAHSMTKLGKVLAVIQKKPISK